MTQTRREIVIGLGASAAALAALPAFAAVDDATIMEVTGEAEVTEGGVDLDAPEIAENGNTVPIEVSAPDAVAITLIAGGNPLPNVATFKFGPMAGAPMGSTRIRLAQTQDLVALAKMPDGSFRKTSALVKVTIGGCGG